MPYPGSPIDWIAGVLASADMNDQVRDWVRWLAGFTANPKGMVRVRSTVPVPLTETLSWTTVTFDTADFNIASTGEELFDISAPTVITFPYDCIALVGGCGSWPAVACNKALRILLNSDDASSLVEEDNVGVSTPAFNRANVTTPYIFQTGDTIELQMFQDSGVEINGVAEGLASPVMWALWFAVSGL